MSDLTNMIAANADWFYLIGAILFVLTLRGLSSPKTAIRGNRFGMVAMAIAVATTFFLAEGPVLWLIIGAMVLGALVGMWKAKTVAMTQMPETVALMHSFVGLAAVAIALATVLHTEQQHGAVARVELFIGCFIGAITFSASVFAFHIPTIAPNTMAPTINQSTGPSAKKNVVATAIAIATIPKRLPRIAVFGLDKPRKVKTKRMAPIK